MLAFANYQAFGLTHVTFVEIFLLVCPLSVENFSKIGAVSYHPWLPLLSKVVRIFYGRRADQQEYFDALPSNQR